MAFIYVSDGIDDVLAQHLNQYADAWTGVAGKGVPLNAVAVNDPINFAISARNLDATNSRALQLLKADGTVLLQVDAAGVKASPDGVVSAATVATLTATNTFTGKQTITSGGLQVTAGNVGIGDVPQSNVGLRLPSTLSLTAVGGSAVAVNSNATLVASANNDVLRGLFVNPTFNNGAFTGVTNLGAEISSGLKVTGGLSLTGALTMAGSAAGQNVQANDANSRFIVQNQISIAVNAFGQICTSTGALAGLALIVAGDGHSALVALMGGNHTVTLLAGTANFSAVFGTAGKYNVGWNTAQYMIENKSAATQVFDIICMA